MKRELKLEDFVKGVNEINNAEITSVAPLGMSSEFIYLMGSKRVSTVSLRKYINQCELLITDKEGNFLTYSKLHLSLNIDYIARKWFEIYEELKPLIHTTIKDYEIEVSRDYKLSKGFELLKGCKEKEKENE